VMEDPNSKYPISHPKRYQKVMTPDGEGKIHAFEDFTSGYRIGVKHTIYPKDKPLRMYKGNILYYFRREVLPIEEEGEDAEA